MSWKACELVWQRGWRCTISASGSTIGSAVPVWPLPICWDGDLNSHQAFKDVLKPPPAAKSDEPQGSQGLADSPEQRFVSKYYAAVGREDWDATYSMLDAASKRQFSREEWVRKQQAHQEARARPPVESAKITNVSGGGDNFTATVELTHEDGTISVMPNFEITQESGKFRRHLTPEDLKFLRSL